jgi:hypothetical protein
VKKENNAPKPLLFASGRHRSLVVAASLPEPIQSRLHVVFGGLCAESIKARLLDLCVQKQVGGIYAPHPLQIPKLPGYQRQCELSSVLRSQKRVEPASLLLPAPAVKNKLEEAHGRQSKK